MLKMHENPFSATKAIFVCHKNVKNTQFSCQFTNFLKLKMHRNPFFGRGSAPDPAGELIRRSPRPPSRLGMGTPLPHFPPPRRLASDPLVHLC